MLCRASPYNHFLHFFYSDCNDAKGYVPGHFSSPTGGFASFLLVPLSQIFFLVFFFSFFLFFFFLFLFLSLSLYYLPPFSFKLKRVFVCERKGNYVSFIRHNRPTISNQTKYPFRFRVQSLGQSNLNVSLISYCHCQVDSVNKTNDSNALDCSSSFV